MYALVDCNNFYVSCERVFNPKLDGNPVVVLSNNDGCIISRSNEAKMLGLKMAEPIFQKTKFLSENGVFIFSSNYALYGDMSQRVIEVLSAISPKVEVYSIDEAFIDLSEMNYDLEKLASGIVQTVKKNTGIPVSVGIGQTKTLAKIANKAAKYTDGVFVIQNNRHRETVLRNTPIEMIWGIGRQYAKLLRKNKVETAYDFTLLEDNWLRNKMKVMGLRIKSELIGDSCIPLEMIVPPKKAIATTRAFGKKTSELKFIEEAVATYSARCSEKLRKQKSVANLLTVFIHTDPFNLSEPQYNKSKTISLPVATNSNTELVKYSLLCLKDIFLPQYKYKKAGVIVEGLQHESSVQGNLFNIGNLCKQKKLMIALDEINMQFGRDMVKLAVQGNGTEWKLKQEKLSKRYTTNLNEIIEVKA